MPYANIDGLETFLTTRESGEKPTDLLGHDKNCVAMAFSKCLGVGVYPTINFFISKGWIPSARALEDDNAIAAVLAGLGMGAIYAHTDWASVKVGMKGQPNGRYFCVNRETRAATGQGHAFAIIKDGGVGIAGNNQEKATQSYNAALKDIHKVSVYGPITRNA